MDTVKLEAVAEEVGVLKERSRIMGEIDLDKLPAGVWTYLRKIINPNAND